MAIINQVTIGEANFPVILTLIERNSLNGALLVICYSLFEFVIIVIIIKKIVVIIPPKFIFQIFINIINNRANGTVFNDVP